MYIYTFTWFVLLTFSCRYSLRVETPCSMLWEARASDAGCILACAVTSLPSSFILHSTWPNSHTTFYSGHTYHQMGLQIPSWEFFSLAKVSEIQQEFLTMGPVLFTHFLICGMVVRIITWEQLLWALVSHVPLKMAALDKGATLLGTSILRIAAIIQTMWKMSQNTLPLTTTLPLTAPHLELVEGLSLRVLVVQG